MIGVHVWVQKNGKVFLPSKFASCPIQLLMISHITSAKYLTTYRKFSIDLVYTLYEYGQKQGIWNKKRKGNVILKWCAIKENWDAFILRVGIRV